MTDFHCFNIGASSSGKTQHFDCCIRRFKSCRPSHNVETKKMSLAKSPIISGFFATQTAIFLCTKTQM